MEGTRVPTGKDTRLSDQKSRRAFLKAAGVAAAGVTGGAVAQFQTVDSATAATLVEPPQATLTTLSSRITESTGVSLRDFGAVGDGVTDDTEAIAAALASGGQILVPSGNFRMTRTISRSFSGVDLRGRPGARIFSDTASALFRMLETDEAHFEGIYFEITTVDAAPDNAVGIFYSLSVGLKNVVWTDCTFRVARRAVNAIKIVADNANGEFCVENVFARSCEFIECARMGLEIQDHTVNPTVTRVRNVGAIDCLFESCGALAHGIDLSFSGPILGAASIQNRFRGSITIALECAGGHLYPILTDNTFEALGANAQTISLTGSSMVHGPVIERNRSLGRSGFGARFWNLTDARLSHNILQFNGYVHVRDCIRGVAIGENYDSGGAYSLFVESTPARECADNVWLRCRFSTLVSAAPYSVTRFYGAKTFRNTVQEGSYGRKLGVRMDQLAGAELNELRRCCNQGTAWAPIRSVPLLDSNRSISIDETDCDAFVFSGALTRERLVTFPPCNRAWQMRNATTRVVSVTAGSSSIQIRPGESRLVSIEVRTITYA
ncbi:MULTISPECIES: glycosyl hydrolase family 28-related protein [Cryobacterium]|uniref:glycosyl hydrolase family 28-related protein n=1 Tax=Cryobacterium TaxID=69578 RepID=UPI000CD3FEA5|nr:hypothetical protein C3B60_03540 [Cryobacterium zongtaii]TFC41113.1 twin-arginine translocation signal domain-containing protein [Cryobacterium sp. TMN-39-2]